MHIVFYITAISKISFLAHSHSVIYVLARSRKGKTSTATFPHNLSPEQADGLRGSNTSEKLGTPQVIADKHLETLPLDLFFQPGRYDIFSPS